MFEEQNKDAWKTGHSYEFLYPNCIVNEILGQFLFEKAGYTVKVTKRDGEKPLWADDNILLKTYLDFVRFICDFVEYEMPREISRQCWGSRIESTIDEIMIMLDDSGKSEDHFAPGIFIDGVPITGVKEYKRLTESIHKDRWNEQK